MDPPQRPLWIAVRQGLLVIVGGIERTYGLRRACPTCDALRAARRD